MLFISSFSAEAVSDSIEKKNIIKKVNNDSGETITEIKLTDDEEKELFSWCETIENTDIRDAIYEALIQTIDTSKNFYILEFENIIEEIDIGQYPEDETKEILPAVVLVRCQWKITDDSHGERTIHFWVFGYGSHELEWNTLDDFNGDGTWDLGPGSPWHYDWTALFFPLRHYDDWAKWGGYSGRAKVKVTYKIDGRSSSKTFEEPKNSGKNIINTRDLGQLRYKYFAKLIKFPKFINLNFFL